MTATKMTVKRRFHLLQKYGYTDAQVRDYLSDRGFKDLDVEIVLAECARNMGFIWSFQAKRWLDKSVDHLGDDQADYDELLDMIRFEKENR